MTPTEAEFNRAASWLAPAYVVALFVVFDPTGWAVFAPLKWSVATVGAAAMVASVSQWRVPTRAAWLWGIALAWGVIVSIGALDPLYTWFGTPDRHLGLLAWMIFGAVFFVGHSIDNAERVARGLVVAGLVVGAIAAFEWIGRPLVELTDASDRLGASFGSPAYLGAAAVLVIPTSVGFAMQVSGGWRKALGAASAITMLAVAVGTQTRAALIGVAVAAAVTFPRWRGPVASRRMSAALGVGLVVVFIAVSPFATRVASTFESGGGVPARIDEWRTGVSAIAEHPLAGAGFEGYRLVFPAVVDAEYERRYGRQVLPDRVHSAPLDVAATAGLVGTVLWMVGMAGIILRVQRGIRVGSPLVVGIAGAVAGYVAQQLFLFPLAEVDPVFWLLVGLLFAATTRPGEARPLRQPAVVVGGLLVLTAVAGWFGIRDVAADRAVATAFAAETRGAAIQEVTRATDLRADSIRYWLAAGVITADSGQPADISSAIVLVDTALVRSPLDPAVARAQADLILRRAQATGEADDIAAALEVWQKLVAGDPNNASHRFELGVILAAVGRFDEAEAQFVLAADLAPRNPSPLVNLATLSLQQGDLAEAEARVESLRRLDPNHPSLADFDSAIAGGTEAP